MPRSKEVINVGREELWSQHKVSGELGVTVRTLENWRAMRTGPAFVKLGHHVYYKVTAIEKWIDDQQTEMPDS